MERPGLPIYPSVNQMKVMHKDNMNPQQPQHQQQQPPFLLGPPQQMLLLGPENTVTVCPFCHAAVKTAVKYTNNTRTHIAAALCCLSGCCCLPYAMDSAKNADHYCPNCQRYLGTYHR